MDNQRELHVWNIVGAVSLVGLESLLVGALIGLLLGAIAALVVDPIAARRRGAVSASA